MFKHKYLNIKGLYKLEKYIMLDDCEGYINKYIATPTNHKSKVEISQQNTHVVCQH